jgi:hypothetical protein
MQQLGSWGPTVHAPRALNPAQQQMPCVLACHPALLGWGTLVAMLE